MPNLMTEMQQGAAVQQMLLIERELAKALRPFNKPGVEGLLVVFALVRLARSILSLYPNEIVLHVVPLLEAFLEGKQTAPGADSPLWTPPGA